MFDTTTLAVFAAASVALYVAPGPDMIYIAARSMGQGRRAGVLSAWGTCTGLLCHTLAAVFGLTALLALSPFAFQVIKWLGVAYLFYLGARILLQDAPAPSMAAGSAAPATVARLYGQGVMVNLLNPKISLFFLAFLPQFTDPERGDPALQMAVLGGLFTAGGLVWLMFLAHAFAGAGRWLERRPGLWRWQRRLTGSILIALAGHLAFVERR
jgi:threonine/homoserine/homoserine lactone efflux protein